MRSCGRRPKRCQWRQHQKDENDTKPPLDYTLSEKMEHQQSADGADGGQDGASGLVGKGAETVTDVESLHRGFAAGGGTS